VRNGGTLEQLKETGHRLSAVREALELSQVEVCRNIGIGETTWNNWEKGRRRPDPIVLVRFANVYGVTLDYVYRGDMQGLSSRIVAKLLHRRCRPDHNRGRQAPNPLVCESAHHVGNDIEVA